MDRLACLGKVEVGGSSTFFGVVMKKIGCKGLKGLDSMKSPKLLGFWMFLGWLGLGLGSHCNSWRSYHELSTRIGVAEATSSGGMVLEFDAGKLGRFHCRIILQFLVSNHHP